MPTAISPYHYDTDFPNGINFDQMLDIFAARVQGWQLDPAEHLLKTNINAGFAVLSILMSYFEAIAQFDNGKNSRNVSGKTFIHGFRMVFPQYQDGNFEAALDRLHKAVCCGLYHDSMTRDRVEMHGEFKEAIQIFSDSTLILINPHKLPSEIKRHLHKYIRQLRTPENQDARTKFAATFTLMMSNKYQIVIHREETD